MKKLDLTYYKDMLKDKKTITDLKNFIYPYIKKVNYRIYKTLNNISFNLENLYNDIDRLEKSQKNSIMGFLNTDDINYIKNKIPEIFINKKQVLLNIKKYLINIIYMIDKKIEEIEKGEIK